MVQTKRLLLRNLTDADVEILAGYRNDIRCSRYQRYENTSAEYLISFVRKYSNSRFLSLEEEQHYAISRLDDKKMVGDLSVFFTEKDSCFTLGITIAPDYQRRGYAVELLKEVVSRLQAQCPSVDIVALIDKGNIGSIALFQKLGFVEECYAESIESYVYVIYGLG